MPQIGIILGSDSDLPRIQDCFTILQDMGVDFEVLVSSAHRTPGKTREWVTSARERGMKAIIAAAGGAAHLPGVVASYTTLPVIGVPIETKISGGLDSLLSIVQMPAGIPVATMPAGSAGGANAALFAVSILAVIDPSYEEKLQSYRKKMADKIGAKNEELSRLGWKDYIAKNLSK